MIPLKRTVFITCCVFSFWSGNAQSPGNVSAGLRWWLKSDAGVHENAGASNTAEDTDGVYTWVDQSSVANNAVQATSANRPIFRNSTGNTINGYPILRFSGDQFLDGTNTPGIGSTASFSIFLVLKQSGWTNGGTTDGNGSYIIDRPPPESDNLISFKMITGDKYFYQRRDNAGNNLGGPTSTTSANTTSFVIAQYYRDFAALGEGIYLNGASDITGTTPNSNMSAPRIRIGRHAVTANNGMSSDFAEIAVYNTNLTSAERNRIQSYLAIKYGITLSSTVDYVRSSGGVIYPSTTTHSSYVHDIAGIGRDDDSDLDHSDSQSQNANSVVRITNPSSLGNNDFLVWGSNNGSLTVPSASDLPTGIVRKLSRIWRVKETNDVGNFTLTVDLSAVPGSKNAADLRLLVDTNGTFAAGATQYNVSSSSGSTFTFINVSITDNDYFTIGTVNATSTPLPIELTAFDIAYESPIVTTSWQTASELNNDYFTLERAGMDLVFEEVGRKPGAGTSKIPHSYSMIDQYPYEGVSYYRLKQTDLDGTSTYSDTKYMFIEETKKQLAVFPNPNEGKQIKIAFGNRKFNLNHIAVINQQGRIIETSFTSSNGLKEYSIELKQKLSPGLYMVKVHYNGKDEFVKLLVH